MLLSLSSAFIKRPVFTTVCSLVILLAGAIAVPLLPIAKLPQIAPTQVKVTSTYIGADAKTTEDTVTTIIEREINGVENMKYISSNTGNDGITNISVSFPTSIDRNEAQVNVQNRVSLAEPRLPDVVKQTGVKVDKASPNILLAYAFYSDKDGNGKAIYDTVFISNYIDLYIFDEIKRLPGVGQVNIIGERKYAMRFFLYPEQLAGRGLTANDVVAAVREQNIQVGLGRIGSEPMSEAQNYSTPLRARGRFKTVEEAEEIVIKTGDNGDLIRLKDVGRAEIGAENYDTGSLYNGEPAVTMTIYQLPGSNALETANAIKSKIEELSKNFPPGLKVDVGFDTSLFVSVAIEDVVSNTFQAIIMTVITILIFLQDWRATIIPTLAMPIAMIGSLVVVLGLGYDLNLLTMFGIILAIGTVTDDAVVIVESIKLKMQMGMRALQASLDAMQELGGATIASALTQLAVFIPVFFFPGTTGIVYRQFAITLAAAIVFSTFNALTFSPTMAALLLKPDSQANSPIDRGFNFLFGWLFRGFNRVFGWVENGYGAFIDWLTRVKVLVILIFLLGLGATVFMFQIVPSGFIPEEDQGYAFIIGQAPANVSLNYTENEVAKVNNILKDFPDLQNYLGVAGFSFDGNGYNQYLFFLRFKDWKDRPNSNQSVFALLRQINGRLTKEISSSKAFAVNAPPVDGLSSTGGFEFQLQNRGGLPIESLIQMGGQIIQAANERDELQGVFTTFTPGSSQIEVVVDRMVAKSLNIDIAEIFRNLETFIGSTYVNDFVLNNRQYRVYVQADEDFRNNTDVLKNLYVRSGDGNLVQMSNIVKLNSFTYPPSLTHYNIYPSIKIQGSPAAGYSSGQAIAAMEEVADQLLTPGFGYEWTGSAAEEKEAGGATIILFGLGFVLVFLVLAAQYESYIDPTIIMLTVPLSTLGALLAIWLRANVFQANGIWPIINNDVYAQVGLLMLIGVAAKNTILIVEFANQSKDLGMNITQAAVTSAKSRFRPIMITALSGLVGYIPLMTAAGAGAISRWSIGTVSFGGYLIATILSLGIAPILYIVIKTFEEKFFNSNVDFSAKKY